MYISLIIYKINKIKQYVERIHEQTENFTPKRKPMPANRRQRPINMNEEAISKIKMRRNSFNNGKKHVMGWATRYNILQQEIKLIGHAERQNIYLNR